MKSLFNLIFFILITFMSSCCREINGTPQPLLSISYKTLDYSKIPRYDILTSPNDLSVIIASVGLNVTPGNSPNGAPNGEHNVLITFREEGYNHLIMANDSSILDTISGTNFSRDKCTSIDTYEYYWNGEYSTDNYREVYY